MDHLLSKELVLLEERDSSLLKSKLTRSSSAI